MEKVQEGSGEKKRPELPARAVGRASRRMPESGFGVSEQVSMQAWPRAPGAHSGKTDGE